MNKRPGHVTVTVETGYCSFCGRPRNLRREEHQLGTLVRSIVTCETCHRTLTSSIGVAAVEAAAEEISGEAPAPVPAPAAAEAVKPTPAPAKRATTTAAKAAAASAKAKAPSTAKSAAKTASKAKAPAKSKSPARRSTAKKK